MNNKIGIYLLLICTMPCLKAIQFQPTKTESYLTIDSIKNNTQQPLALYEGTKKILDIPVGQTVQPSWQFVLEKSDSLLRKHLKIASTITHAQLIVIQRPRKNRTLYGYIIYKKINSHSQQESDRMKTKHSIGKDNHLSIIVHGNNDIESIQLKLEINTTGKQIEIEKE